MAPEETGADRSEPLSEASHCHSPESIYAGGKTGPMVYLPGMGRSASSQPTPTTQKNEMEEQGTEGSILAVLAPLNRVRSSYWRH